MNSPLFRPFFRRLCISGMTLIQILLASQSYAERSATKPVMPEIQPVREDEMADRLVLIDTASAFNDATLRHLQLSEEPIPHLILHDPSNSEYPRLGTWTSDEQKADFPFTQLIPSWNVSTPPETGIRFFVRTQDAASKEWSPWLFIGFWGRPWTPKDPKVIEFDGGKADIDTVLLNHPATAWQIQAQLASFQADTNINPSIRRIAVVYSGAIADPIRRKEILSATTGPVVAASTTEPTTQPAWAINIPVPFRAQGSTPNAMRHQTCSPTSTTMVMAYWNADRPLIENCMAIYDDEYHVFGNWDRAVARAGELGLDAWINRYRNWDQVKAELANGQPLIASIRYKEGEFPSSLFKSSAGHLIVLRGMTPDGDLICNDPGSSQYGKGVVYKAADLARAWFASGGVGYVIKGQTRIAPPHPSTQPVPRKTDRNNNIEGED